MRPWLFLVALAWAVSADAQVIGNQPMSEYEAMYGTPVDVTITDLLHDAQSYEGRSVRTTGRLELDSLRSYSLRDLFSGVSIVPVRELQGIFETEAPRSMGRDVQVVGVFRSSGSSGVITFWKFVPPEEPRAKGPIKSTSYTLEALVQTPGRHDGQTVKVVGKFRGRNLYGDLPTRSEKNSSDWVIKDDLYAVWVTGKKPKGGGWELDPGLKRDTGKWIEVVGRVESQGGVTYIHAMELTLTTAPTPTSDAQAPPPPPERPKVPPVVVFSLPLDGDQEVPADSRFVIQFSKDMDAETFKGRVRLQYAGPTRVGDRGFDGMKLQYDEGRRALTVDPGDHLRPGRQLELFLYPGIADLDGLSLVPRSGQGMGDAVDVLRYQVGL
jgi:hypothetical protein